MTERAKRRTTAIERARAVVRRARDAGTQAVLEGGFERFAALARAVDALDSGRPSPAAAGAGREQKRSNSGAALRASTDARLAAAGHLLIGSVHAVCGAPEAAVAALRRCVELDPRSSDGWLGLAEVLIELGEPGKARRAAQRGFDLRACDESWLALERARDAARAKEPPVPATPLRRAAERLAIGDVEGALGGAAGRSPAAVLMRARAHGAQGDADAALADWMALGETRGPIETALADWFFVPRRLREDARFWDAVVRIGGRLAPDASFLLPAALEAAAQRRAVRGVPLRRRDYFLLFVELERARLRADSEAAARVAQGVPEWAAARSVARRLAPR